MTVQAGLNMGPPPKLNGITPVRAVVVNVYFADDPGSREERGGPELEAKGVSVDVVVYGPSRGFLARVPVSQRRHGMNDYTDLWVPRATTVDLTTGKAPVIGRSADGEPASDPRNFDGDHVIVEFLENNPGLPFIRDSLPHPKAKYRQLRSDATMLRTKLRGVELSLDQNGNVRIDTTKANNGDIDPATGNETPADDAAHGRLTVLVGRHTTLDVQGVAPDGTTKTFELSLKDGEFEVRLNDGDSLKVDGNGGNTITLLGDGAMSAAIAEHMRSLYNALTNYLTTELTVPTGMGPSGPASTPPPFWDDKIVSTKLKLPDG